MRIKAATCFLRTFLFLILSATLGCSHGATNFNVSVSEIAKGWSKTSVNATIFRKNSIVSRNGYQYLAFYDEQATVVLARRKVGAENWEVKQTQYKGNVYDAHNVISIMLDGDGYLHMSWDHHNNALNYCKSIEPYGILMGEKFAMVGENEQVVSYPEFYSFANGDLLFAYRDGGSGNGNLVLNKYSTQLKKWVRLQSNLIDGEGQRNAYWQLHIDEQDHILVSWVWRETPDVASNHDMCFAQSVDGGVSWQNSKEEAYVLPINLKTAEIIWEIPQNSNLINQTSMTSDAEGNVYIATYYKAQNDSCTQFHLIYSINGKWQHSTVTKRQNDFNLSGTGTRVIPVSRPQVVVGNFDGDKKVMLVYRDSEWENHAVISSASITKMDWQAKQISPMSLGKWEPSFDTELWKHENVLHLFIQNVGQGQAETTVDVEPQMVVVLELFPKN